MSIGPSADATSGFDGLEVVTDDIMARSDAELLAASRTGDQLAYGELFRRHAPAATALARRLTGHPSDADDLVSEAFTKVLSALKNGSGPTSAMRPYLLTAVRRVHVDKAVAGQRVQPTDDIGAHDPGVPFVDPALADLERSMVAQAYQQLPERWQMVLWHTEVEELSPRDIAPLLGMSPNAVAALALRARAGLREAYLAAHISSTATAECQRLLPKLAAYVRGSAAARERAAVERHLPDCEDCRAVLVELQDVGGRMRAVVAPLVLGLGASGYLADIALLPKLALPMAKIGAVGHGAGVVAGPPAPTGASGATGGGGGAGGGGASGAAGWAVAALAALIVAGAVISAIALSHNDGPADQAGRPASASQSANQPGDSNSAPTPPGATAPPPPLGPTAGGSNSPKPLSERTGSGRTPTAAAVAPSASTPVPTAPPTAAKTSAPTYVPPEPSTTTPTTPPTSPSTTPTDPTSTTSTTTTPPPPPPDAPTPSSLTAGDFVSGGNGLISVSLSEVAAVTTTVTVTLPVPLSSTAAGCAPDASGATVCTLTIVPGTDFVSLPVQVGAVDATTTVEVPMVVSGEGLTAKTGTSQVVIEPAGTYGSGLPGRYTTLDNVTAQIGGGSWLTADDDGLSTPSTATINLPGAVAYARLYWVGYDGGPTRESMDLTAPDGTVLTVTAAPEDTIDVPRAGQPMPGWPGTWQSSADVTSFLATHGSGAYTGSQTPFEVPAQTGGNRFAGWVLVVVAEDPSVPRQLFTLSDGYALLTPQQSFDTYTNAATTGANRVNIVGFGGDTPNRDSMYYTVDGTPVLFRENDFNGDGIDSTSPVNVGMDLASIDMTANPYPISVVADADRIYLGIMTVSKDR